MQVVRVAPDNSAFAELCDDMVREFQRANVLPFLGAGISAEAPSWVPTIPTLLDPLHKYLIACVQLAWRRRAGRPLPKDALRKILRDAPFEQILDALRVLQPDAVRDYLQVLDHHTFNDNHAALAALGARGCLPYCVTLNFDVLIERAFDARGARSLTRVPLLQDGFGAECRPDTVIIKPHGSFAAPGVSEQRSRLLLPTLGEVGSSPHAHNHDAIAEAVDRCGVLLVAGYGKTDWDVWPIIRRLGDRLERIVWFKFTDADVGPPDWLQSEPRPHVVVTGPVVQLFRRCARALDPQFQSVSIRDHRRPMLNTATFDASTPSLRGACAAAQLVPMEEWKLRQRILNAVRAQPAAARDPALLSSICSTSSWTRYTLGGVRSALALKRRAIALQRAAGAECTSRLPGDLVGLAYLYMALTKKPRLGSRVGPHLAFIGYRQARKYHDEARRLSVHSQVERTETYIRLHWLSVRHHWLLLAQVCPWPLTVCIRFRLARLGRDYRALLEHVPRFMDREYFELRAMEAELVARVLVSGEEARSRLDELERSFGRAGNSHVASVYVCRALLAHRERDPQAASEWLQKAECRWEQEGTSAGLWRALLLRCSIGALSRWQLVRVILARLRRKEAKLSSSSLPG